MDWEGRDISATFCFARRVAIRATQIFASYIQPEPKPCKQRMKKHELQNIAWLKSWKETHVLTTGTQTSAFLFLLL